MMVEKELAEYQLKAIDSIVHTIEHEKKNRVLISMPAGTGVTRVILSAAQRLKRIVDWEKAFIIVSRIEIKKQFEEMIAEEYGSDKINALNYEVMTYSRYASSQVSLQSALIICYEAENTAIIPEPSSLKENNVFLLGLTNRLSINAGWFQNIAPSYSYTIQQAVFEGVLSSVEYPKTRGTALEGFCSRLLESYGMEKSDYLHKEGTYRPDIVFRDGNNIIAVECKFYRDQMVSSSRLFLAISRLAEFVHESKDAIGLIILIGEIGDSDRDIIQKNRDIFVWDISNLLFLTEPFPDLRKELEQLSLFSLAGLPSVHPKFLRKLYKAETHPIVLQNAAYDAEKLRQELQKCPSGQKYAGQYEKICYNIVRFLFSENFNRISSQHKTREGLFRFDTICVLKDTGSFWKALREYYHSHFVVFEYKNYSKALQQNLIYTTEKYLLQPALRNVAIIISRRGFSDNARFAADGCLKEHGKLLFDITDKDLIDMIDQKVSGKNPSDYLLDKLEDILMGIGK